MVDRYTKAVLTVIAVCLVILVFRTGPNTARAQYSGPAHVIVDKVQSFAFQFAGPLEVRVAP